MKRVVLDGRRFGKLVVRGFAGKGGWKNKRRMWACICDCGKEVEVATSRLGAGNALNCGCCELVGNARGYKHGFSPDNRSTPEYTAYHAAKDRCNNPRSQSYRRYGARGIRFMFNSFEEFISHIGRRPEGHVLDRTNNDGNYEIGNVRWATKSQSILNTERYLAKRRGAN